MEETSELLIVGNKSFSKKHIVRLEGSVNELDYYLGLKKNTFQEYTLYRLPKHIKFGGILKLHHLYILNNEIPVRIKKGDKFIFWGNGYNDICEYIEDAGYGIRAINLENSKICLYARSQCSNTIFASTDTRLNLPLPSLNIFNFYKEYITSIENKDKFIGNGVIDVNSYLSEVFIECEELLDMEDETNTTRTIYKPIINYNAVNSTFLPFKNKDKSEMGKLTEWLENRIDELESKNTSTILNKKIINGSRLTSFKEIKNYIQTHFTKDI